MSDYPDYAVYCATLTVLELVTRLEDWAITNVIGGRSQVYPEREILVAALRKAVIREASIGQVFFTTDKHPVAIGAKELKVGGRTFDLILKETSGERPY